MCARETEPLGTAGGFLNAVRACGQNARPAWLVLNGDSLAFADLARAAVSWPAPVSPACYSAVRSRMPRATAH